MRFSKRPKTSQPPGFTPLAYAISAHAVALPIEVKKRKVIIDSISIGISLPIFLFVGLVSEIDTESKI